MCFPISWVVTTPAAPRARAVTAEEPREIEPPEVRVVTRPGQPGTANRSGTKAAVLIGLAAGRHDLTTLPLKQVSAIATELAPAAQIHPSTARRVLLGHVRSLQNRSAS